MKSGYQHMVEHLVGTENLIYLTMDYPDDVRELVELIAAKNRKTVEYTAESKIEACLSWEDSSTTNLSPALYREYIAPEITEWVKILRESGKLYIQHACGHIRDLLLPIAEQGVTAIESISPPPHRECDNGGSRQSFAAFRRPDRRNRAGAVFAGFCGRSAPILRKALRRYEGQGICPRQQRQLPARRCI